MSLRWACLLLLPLLACERTAGELAANEIAAELRALRAALPKQAATPLDPARVAGALQPLGQALTELAREQTTLGLRQQQLVAELRLCVKLVGDGVQDAAAQAAAQQEATALRARLVTVEKELAEQLQRHAAVEAALQAAVLRATQQLESLLVPPTGSSTGPPSGPAPQPPPSSPSGPPAGPGTAPPDPGAASGPPPVADSPRPAGEAIEKGSLGGDGASPWALVVALCAACSLLWWWRWRVPGAPPEPAAVVGMDRGVEEIWAAAELLGEAVGKLRSTRQPEQAVAAPGGVATASSAADELLGSSAKGVAASRAEPVPPRRAPAAAGLPPAAASAPAAPSQPSPATLQFVVPLAQARAAQGLATLQQVLAADPRVLRRPAPEVVVASGRAAVRCAVLPGLPPAERSHLEQCLRDAVA